MSEKKQLEYGEHEMGVRGMCGQCCHFKDNTCYYYPSLPLGVGITTYCQMDQIHYWGYKRKEKGNNTRQEVEKKIAHAEGQIWEMLTRLITETGGNVVEVFKQESKTGEFLPRIKMEFADDYFSNAESGKTDDN